MKLFEYEAKRLLKEYGISIPRGDTASNPTKVEAIAEAIGGPVVLKAQILVSGRGKAGGIRFADDAGEARKTASALLGLTIKGCVVTSLLVEEKLDIAEQFYASITVDRQAKQYIVLASTKGGVDIEEVARTSPDSIARHWVDTASGFGTSDALAMLSRFDMNKDVANKLAIMLTTLYQVVMECDAELVELNPLVRTTSGEFIAADSRMIIDDNAIFRHAEFKDRSLQRVDDTANEAKARKQNLSYVDLDGDIGIVGNGAGLVMATIDLVQTMGGQPGNFLDLGGIGNIEVSKKGIMLVMTKPEIKVVMVNVLGGITRCDIVAEAVVQALNESSLKKPVVVRLMGTNEEEGARILEQAGIISYRDMEEAVAQVVKIQG
ncbi:MAG: ADP-forming succinate--CoA ligase subunit beta [Chloroflexi bacterium]|nr:ADP-forming succinate--CoA ligase subunit beta [Chloroflexota bacterium]